MVVVETKSQIHEMGAHELELAQFVGGAHINTSKLILRFIEKD